MASEVDILLGITLLNLTKTVAPALWVPDTSAKGNEHGQKLVCGFDADHPQIGRYKLNIRIGVGKLDQVSFHTHLAIKGKRATLPIYRLDLNPGSGHMNPVRNDDPDGGRFFAERESHEHCIEDDAISGSISFARQPRRPISDFSDAWAYFCDRILISNPSDLPEPSPQGLLI